MSDDPEESAYYQRLVSMYMDLGTETVLDVFVHHSPGKDAEAFLKANQNAVIKLKTDHVLNEEECASLLQKGTHVLKNPLDLNLLDVSLLITLARNLFTSQQLPPPAKGWKYPPRNFDKSIAADLLRLKTTRTRIVCHCRRARLPKWLFDDEWQRVSEIILRLQQQIAPGNVVHFKERIEKYRVQRLDPSVENKYDEKLKKWHEEVTKVQDQVEELIKNLEGFDAYFKSKSDRFERYIKLLTKGGHFVLSALLDKKIEKQERDLRSILDDKEETFRRTITDSKQLDLLYPSTNTTDPLDTSSWDVSLLSTVILLLFNSTQGSGINQDVKNIGDAQRNYADVALVALDSNTFEDYWTDLKASIKIVSRELDVDKAARCHKILEECKKRISENEFLSYLDGLKAKGCQMKTFTDVFKDTLEKTKDFLQDMITHGISFKYGHELELKMLSTGTNEKKKELAEKILTEVWHEALDRSIKTTHFPEVEKEVLRIWEEIKMSKSVKNITIERKCESTNCQPKERGVTLSITVTSPAGMKRLTSLCSSGEISNIANSIADTLSEHLNDKVELKISTKMKELHNIFDADNSSFDSRSDCSSTESSVKNSYQLNQPDVPEESPERKSRGNMPSESTGQELDDKTDHLKESHKDKSIKKETEAVTVPPDIHTAKSSDPDESDRAFTQTKRDENKSRCWEDVETVNDAQSLFDKGLLPDRYRLSDIFRRHGMKSKIVALVCENICKKIEAASPEILHVFCAYDNENRLHFVVYFESESIPNLKFDYEILFRSCQRNDKKDKNIIAESEGELLAEESVALRKTVNSISKQFMDKHKYLSIITARKILSEERENLCIVMYVHPCTDRYSSIPFTEEPLPTEIKGYKVVVRNGVFKTATNTADEHHDNLLMGCKVTSNLVTGFGTLGGFIDHPEYGLCGFTCAHVVCSSKQMEKLKKIKRLKWSSSEDTCFVYQPSCHTTPVGRVVEAFYTEGGDSGSAGVDLALFQIENRPPVSGNFSSCSSNEIIRFDMGKTWGKSRITPSACEVQKFGVVTGVTKGNVGFDGMSVRELAFITNRVLQSVGVYVDTTLYNQYEIVNGTRHFCEQGDSGGLVFMKDCFNELVCIGMINGVLDKVSPFHGVVTPITDILRELNVQNLKPLKKELTLDDVEKKLSEHAVAMQANFQTMQSYINDRVSTSENNTLAKIMEIQKDVQSSMSQMFTFLQTLKPSSSTEN